MQVLSLDHPGPWRFDDLADADLPDDGRRYEVVDGILHVSPPPTPWHQAVSAALFTQLQAACPPQWRVLFELGLPLGTDGRVPDLSVVLADSVRRGRRAFPTPAQVGLVVEVVSPSSRKTDRFAKPGEYAEAGVPLFWRVETEPQVRVLAFVLDGERYVRGGEVAEGGLGDLPVPWGTVRVDLTQLPS